MAQVDNGALKILPVENGFFMPLMSFRQYGFGV
jgi:hypothetical protein